MGTFNLGGRAAEDGDVLFLSCGICVGFGIDGNISNVDASLLLVLFLASVWTRGVSVEFLSELFLFVFIIGNLMRRVRGRTIIYNPNIVMKIAIAIDT